MYENYIHQGYKLSYWVKAFHYMFSLGELYQLAKSGKDFNKFLGMTREHNHKGNV